MTARDVHRASAALLPFSWIYGLALRGRNLYYDRTAGAVHRAGVPVISVGNLTVGGTGKTPLVIELVRRLSQLGRKPGILTRGYRRTQISESDEVLEYRDAVPDAPVIVHPDRVAGAALARERYGVDCLVLDDAFQHRRIHRDLDIVVIDALNPWGGDAVLPAGRLREPLSGLRRAGLFVISRANQVQPRQVDEIRRRIECLHMSAGILTTRVEPAELRFLDNRVEPVEELHEWRVMPVCGIGNPTTFVQLVKSLAGQTADPVIFDDHHRYSTADADNIRSAAVERDVEFIITTRKDWVKLAPLWRRADDSQRAPLVRLDVRIAVDDAAGLLTAALQQTMAK